MRVLLVNTNRVKLPQPVIPIGICNVASALQRQNIVTHVLDLCFAGSPVAAISETIASFAPDCVGLSIRNLDNSDYREPRFYLPEVKPVVEAIRQRTSASIVLGGPAVSIAPWSVLDYFGCNIAVVRDGDETIADVVSALSRGALPETSGVSPRSDGKLVVTPPKRHSTVLDLPAPRVHRWLNLHSYLRYHVPLPVQTKRGCTLKCSYCTYRSIEGEGYRFKAAEQVAEEIEEMASETGWHFFEIVDSTFNCPESHALDVCRALARLDRRVVLQGSINPASCSPELLAAMKRVGFSNVVCTPDSASDVVLSNLGKGFGSESLWHLVDNLHAVDMPVLWCFLFGGPGETEETVRETLMFINTRLTGRDVVLISAGIRVYPGTELARLAAEQGVIDEHTDLLRPTFYFSASLSPQRFASLMTELLPSNRRYVFSSDLSMGFLLPLQRMASVLRLKTPLWQYAPIVNRLFPKRGSSAKWNGQ